MATARERSPVKMLFEPNRLLNSLALLRVYVSMAGTIIAYLAFTWSTVVLLGGYVTSLQKKDFWCLTVISLLEATRLFNDLESEAKPFDNIGLYMRGVGQIVWPSIHAQPDKEPEKEIEKKTAEEFTLWWLPWREWKLILLSLFKSITLWPALAMIYLIVIFVDVTPIVFLLVPCWRLWHRDYGVSGGDNGQASLRPALDIFYWLVLLQGVLAFYLCFSSSTGRAIFTQLEGQCNFPVEWGRKALNRYLWDTTEKCKKNPASIEDMSLFHHASELVGSESWEDYTEGLRVVGTLVKQGFQGSRKFILPSRPKVQKLIDTLGYRTSDSEDMRQHVREFAATVVADFAIDLHLSQFPGAIRCISSLLETTHEGEGVTSNELILQGLKILEKLAFDHHNSEVICRAPGLLPKIMEPIYSSTLIQDIRINARASVVNGSFRLVHRLIRTPGETGTTLRLDISTNKQAVTNLGRILQDGTVDNKELQRIMEDDKILQKRNRIPKDHKIDRQERKRMLLTRQELQILAMEILTELVLDSSIDLSTDTQGSFIEKQLQIFLADEGEQEPATMFISKYPLKTASGKALALLSKSEGNSLFMISKYDDLFYRLIQIFDARSMIHRTIAAQILENLCTHRALKEERLKDTLLPKVLTAVLITERKLKIEEASQSRNYAQGGDEENQNEKKQLRKPKPQKKSLNKGNKEQTDLKKWQEALLSLMLQIYNLIGADSFALVVQEKAPGEGAFVAYLKTIVEENYEATPNALRIVKLCCQIAMSMVQNNQYQAHFKNQKFVESLSTASVIMSELESCMLVTGTNCQMKPVRPLLSAVVSDLEERLTEVFMPIG